MFSQVPGPKPNGLMSIAWTTRQPWICGDDQLHVDIREQCCDCLTDDDDDDDDHYIVVFQFVYNVPYSICVVAVSCVH